MPKKNHIELPEPEWTYLIEAEDIANDLVKLEIEPSAAEKKALAERLSVSALNNLKASVKLKRVHGNRSIHVTGSFEADLVQHCVVSLEPIEVHISDDFEAWFADAEQAVSIKKAKHDLMVQKGQAEMPMLEEEDAPESLDDGQINLGEVVTQFLALSINPYPHADGVVFEHGDDDLSAGVSEDDVKNPFAALKDWKDRHNAGE